MNQFITEGGASPCNYWKLEMETVRWWNQMAGINDKASFFFFGGVKATKATPNDIYDGVCICRMYTYVYFIYRIYIYIWVFIYKLHIPITNDWYWHHLKWPCSSRVPDGPTALQLRGSFNGSQLAPSQLMSQAGALWGDAAGPPFMETPKWLMNQLAIESSIQ